MGSQLTSFALPTQRVPFLLRPGAYAIQIHTARVPLVLGLAVHDAGISVAMCALGVLDALVVASLAL